MKFVGMSKEDRKLVLEALEMVSRVRFVSLDACKPRRAGMPDAKPEVIAAYEADIKAIEKLYTAARAGDAVIITGKGTDPFIMGPRGTKTPWDDAKIAHEELEKLNHA